jgi:hypothetical protein
VSNLPPTSMLMSAFHDIIIFGGYCQYTKIECGYWWTSLLLMLVSPLDGHPWRLPSSDSGSNSHEEPFASSPNVYLTDEDGKLLELNFSCSCWLLTTKIMAVIPKKQTTTKRNSSKAKAAATEASFRPTPSQRLAHQTQAFDISSLDNLTNSVRNPRRVSGGAHHWYIACNSALTLQCST